MNKYRILIIMILLSAGTVYSAELNGELKQWHRITLTFDGPETAEQDSNNPFLNYRMTVTFTHQQQFFVVPGFYAADGDAGHSGADSGNNWPYVSAEAQLVIL